MEFIVHNLTPLDLSISASDSAEAKGTFVSALSRASFTLGRRPRWHASLIIRGEAEENRVVYELTQSRLQLLTRKTWALASDDHAQNVPWRIYIRRKSKSSLDRPSRELIILPRRDLSRFLSDIEDDRFLSDLCLPGTHDTLAFYGWPISQCQYLSTPLSTQLQCGIRVLDVRLAVVDERLIAYHGSISQKLPFQTALAAIHEFLTNPDTCRETVIMSIKQEDFTETPLTTFSALVHAEIYNGPGGRNMWFLENRIPHLGEVRGKVVMLSRFGGDGNGWENKLEGLGIHPTTWPDSKQEGFSWYCKNTLVRTHDWYNISSFLYIPEKTALATSILRQPTPSRTGEMPTLNITYFSAGSFPLALPATVARGFGWPEWGLGVEGVNSRAGRWLLDQYVGTTSWLGLKTGDRMPLIRGWVFIDFFASPENLAPLLVEFNYRQ